MRKALLLAGALVAVAAGSAHTAARALPKPLFRAHGLLEGLAAAGDTAAIGISKEGSDCVVQLANLTRGTQFKAIAGTLPCSASESAGGAQIAGLWLGRTAVALDVFDSPSPHGDTWSHWSGPRPAGPLRQAGAEWGWTDSDVPMGYGCEWATASGGGVIAAAQVPNRLAVDQGLETKPACPGTGATRIELQGATRAALSLPFRAAPIATDGKGVVLARLDDQGRRTGEIAFAALPGATSRAVGPVPDAARVKAATSGWLTPDGLVLAGGRRLSGPGWTVARTDAATVGERRVVYAAGRTLRVRRTRGGPDRALLALPAALNVDLAAGSFGVAVAIDDGNGGIALYRVPWRTIDRTLTAR